MNCIKCGARLSDGATYCIRCGTYQVEEDQKNEQLNEVETNNKDINYDILVQAYIGKRYNSFIYSKFSWGCFFLGPLYCLCRKMYSYSLFYVCVLLITSFLSRLVTWWFEIICILVICWFFGYKFKSSYLEKVKRRVNKIVINNPELDMVMLQEKCRKKGGLNVFWVVVATLYNVFLIFAFCSLIILSFNIM